MRKYILMALILVGAGIGISLFLIPTTQELSELQARDAIQIDLGNIDLEAEYAQGRRSFPIINALVDKRIEEGNRPAAIALLEEYVTGNPSDVNGHKRLAEQYQLAGDYAQYNRELEAIAAAEPTEANLKILSDIYNAEKNYPKQIEMLARIIEVTDGENPDYYADLATIQMIEGRLDDALITVDILKSKHPLYSSYALSRIHVSALSQKAMQEQAFLAADARATSHPNPDELADYANILHYIGKDAERAIELIEKRKDTLTQRPSLILAYVNANITAGRQGHAYETLEMVDKASALPPELYPVYLELALTREDNAAAMRIVAQLNPRHFTEEQALNLLELIRAKDEKPILMALIKRFQEPDILHDRPVLDSVIALILKDKNQDDKIATALALDLNATQRLRLAEACARAGKNKCFDTLVAKFPAIDDMSPAQVAEFAQLHIVANRAGDIVDAVGIKARKNPVYETNHAHLRLAAAAGRSDIMDIWLEPNAATAPLSQLQEYFYLANGQKHGKVASQLAQALYSRDPSPANRDIMISALLGAGNHAQALVLLREKINEPGADDALYISTLSKLARKDKTARKELTDYAYARLKNNEGTNQQQLNYTYSLINHGRKKDALPLVRTRAKEKGGAWRKMLAQLTPPKGGKGGSAPVILTRAQYLELAKKPGITAENKRQIAFNLYNLGHKQDAALLFQDLAAEKGADSQEMQDLLFIWGGKLNDNQFNWVSTRAMQANAFDKRGWQSLINLYGEDAQIMRYVANDGQALYHQLIRQRYFRLLASQHGPDVFDTAMRPWVKATNDTAALHDYADVANAYGYNEAATYTYARITQTNPNDKRALVRLAGNHIGKGRFSKAWPLINHAATLPSTTPQDRALEAEATFYRAELHKRDGNRAKADEDYRQVSNLELARFEREGSLPLDAETRLNASLFHIGKQAQARDGFEFLLRQNPTDKGLLADYMAILIEYDYVRDALKIANQYDKSSTLLQEYSSLKGHSADVAGIAKSNDGRTLVLSFSEPIDGQSPLAMPKDNPQWLQTARADFDTLTVSAKPGYVLRYVPTSSEEFTIVSSAEEASKIQLARAQSLRLQLLYAQIEQKLGQEEQAQIRLANVQQHYPNEPQLIAARAAIESAQGNNFDALDIIRQAQTLAPEHEDYNRLANALSKTGRKQFVKLDHEYRSFGEHNEQITTLSGAVKLGNRAEVGATIRNDIMEVENLRRGDTGQIGNFDTTRQQAELYLAYYLGQGQRLQASVFANNDTPGAGLYYSFKNSLGNSEAFAEYHRPYWDFVEAVFDHANRDRLGLRHLAQLSSDTSFGVETSLNRYNSETGDDLLNSGLIRANVVHALQDEGPYLAVGYGFDGEYLFNNRERRRDPNGFTYFPFPLISREVHLLSGIVRHNFTPDTEGFFTAGYAYDRLGLQDGPVVEARLTQAIDENLEAGLRARYGVQTNGDSSDAINAGAHVQYNF